MRTKVSAKSQVSIPSAIRKEFNIKPNTQLEWIAESGLITVIPVTDDPVAAFRGRGKGLDPTAKLIFDRQREREEENGKREE